MRTAGQGQAAVPGERVRRRRANGLPEPFFLGRRENIPRTVTKVERYPEVPGLRLGASGFAVERAAAPRGFVLREMGECVPPNRHPLCPCFLPRRGEGKEQNGIFLGGKYI